MASAIGVDAAGLSNSPSHRDMTTVARQLPTTLSDVRAMSISASTPRITATACNGNPNCASAPDRITNDARGTADGVALVDEQSTPREPGAKVSADELVETLACDGNAEQEEPDEQRRLVRVAESPEVRGQLRRSREELVARREPPLDLRGFVARRAEQPRELDAVLQGIRARGSRSRRASPPSEP